MGLRFAYNTNGFAFHDLGAIVDLLAEAGYDGIALTLDHHHLDPRADDVIDRAWRLRERLDAAGLAVAVETGARFILDPRRKHEPSLASPEADGRTARAALLSRSVEIATALGAKVVTAFGGRVDGTGGASREEALQRVADAIAPVIAAADAVGVAIAIEPEPAHVVETMADFDALRARLGPGGGRLRMTLDLGHVLVSEPATSTPGAVVRERAALIRHVHIEDARRAEHVHLPFGEGELDLPEALAALIDVKFDGLVAVELSRHSHEAPVQVRRSIERLRAAVAAIG